MKKKSSGSLSPESRLWAAMNELHARVWFLELPWHKRLRLRWQARRMQRARGGAA